MLNLLSENNKLYAICQDFFVAKRKRDRYRKMERNCASISFYFVEFFWYIWRVSHNDATNMDTDLCEKAALRILCILQKNGHHKEKECELIAFGV